MCDPDCRTERYIKAAAADTVFATTRGSVKPGKHLCLGMGIKSMTGSRKVLEILNHFGHSVNYHTAEELETTLATNISTTDVSTPDGLNRRPGLATALAWDNYDENTETLSGAGKLHDTFGICYQNTMPEIPTEPDPDTSEPEIPVSTGEKRKRLFSMKSSELQPYRKKTNNFPF